MSVAAITSPPADNATPGHARLAIWLNKLPQHPLPVDISIARQTLRLLDNEDCDCQQLARQIKQDPALCLKLFHCGDNALRGREGDIQHMAHLTSLLGFKRIENIVRECQHVSKRHDGLYEIFGASLFAAQLASELLSVRHGAANERFFIPTLLFNAPLWLMWISAPKTMAQGQHKVSREQYNFIQLGQKMLGFELPELFRKARTFVHLPKTTQKALEVYSGHSPHFWAKAHYLSPEKFEKWLKSDKQARQHLYCVEMGVYLLNQYALAVYLDWNGKSIQRYTRLLCRHLKMNEQMFNTTVLDLTMHMPLPHYLRGKLSPLQRLRGLHREETEDTQNNRIELWLKKIKACDTVDSALHQTLEALHKGVGAEHCIIMTINDEEIQIQSQYGYAQESPITSFHQSRVNLKNLFGQLIRQPACVIIPPEDLDKAAKKMPAQFTKYCELKPCGFLSVFHDNKPKALIYCGRSHWDQSTHHKFKIVGQSLSQTLKQLH
jgi:hypothetical protein